MNLKSYDITLYIENQSKLTNLDLKLKALIQKNDFENINNIIETYNQEDSQQFQKIIPQIICILIKSDEFIQLCQQLIKKYFVTVEIQILVLNRRAIQFLNNNQIDDAQQLFLKIEQLSQNKTFVNHSVSLYYLSYIYDVKKCYETSYKYAQLALFSNSRYYNQLLTQTYQLDNLNKTIVERQVVYLIQISYVEKIKNNQDICDMYALQSDYIMNNILVNQQEMKQKLTDFKSLIENKFDEKQKNQKKIKIKKSIDISAQSQRFNNTSQNGFNNTSQNGFNNNQTKFQKIHEKLQFKDNDKVYQLDDQLEYNNNLNQFQTQSTKSNRVIDQINNTINFKKYGNIKQSAILSTQNKTSISQLNIDKQNLKNSLQLQTNRSTAQKLISMKDNRYKSIDQADSDLYFSACIDQNSKNTLALPKFQFIKKNFQYKKTTN